MGSVVVSSIRSHGSMRGSGGVSVVNPYNAGDRGEYAPLLTQLTALVRRLGGSIYLPGVSNFENTTVATGIDDPAELDDPIAYAGDLTTYDLPENMLINSVFAGAVVGAPGTMPTGWTKTASGSGLTTEITASSASSISVRVSGTANATTAVTLVGRSTTVETAAKPGEMWSYSADVAVTGTIPSARIVANIAERTAAGTLVTSAAYDATIGSTRITRILSGATTERLNCRLDISPQVGDVYDCVITISNIQLERGRARAYVPTTTAAISRGVFNPAFQATTANKPFLRSKDYSRAQWVSGQNNLGTELVTNGGFDSALTGWTDISFGTGTATASGGGVAVVGVDSSNRGAITQGFATEAGKRYLVRMSCTARTSGAISFGYHLTAPTFSGLVYVSNFGAVSDKSYVVTATGSTTWVAIWSDSGGSNGVIDNFSVKELLTGTGELWSITNTAVADNAAIKWGDGDAYLRCPGVAGNVATTPDSTAADIVGSISFLIRLYKPTWSPAATEYIVSKWTTTGDQRSYAVYNSSAGRLGFAVTSGGVTDLGVASTAGVPVPADTNYLKVLVNADNGMGGWTAEFLTSPDGVTFTRLGNLITTAGTLAIHSGTSVLSVGGFSSGGLAPVTGKIYYAAIYNNATATGTPVVEFNPARDCIRPKSAALDFDNSNDYLQTPINPTSSGYMCVAARQDEALGGANVLLGAYKTSATIQAGVALSINASGNAVLTRCGADGTTDTATSSTAITVGVPFVVDAEWSATGSKVRINGVGEGVSTGSKNASNAATILTVGARNIGTAAAPSITDVFGGAIYGVKAVSSVPSDSDKSTSRKLIAQIAGVSGVV